jgi:hypothetical protein
MKQGRGRRDEARGARDEGRGSNTEEKQEWALKKAKTGEVVMSEAVTQHT